MGTQIPGKFANKMDLAQAVLTCTESASELELSDILRGLSVAKLKTLCAELKLKVSGNKAEIITQLDTAGIDYGGVQTEDRSNRVPRGYHMAEFEKIPTWTKDISGLKSFTLRQLVEYLIDSRDKTLDNESMKAFKSLKAYKYFHDGLVKNIWAHSQLDESEIILRARFLVFENQINLHCVCVFRGLCVCQPANVWLGMERPVVTLLH